MSAGLFFQLPIFHLPYTCQSVKAKCIKPLEHIMYDDLCDMKANDMHTKVMLTQWNLSIKKQKNQFQTISNVYL